MDSVLNSYGTVVFERILEDYSTTVNAVLGNEKAQQLSSPEQAPHSYQDKYVLVEQLTNCIGATALNSLIEIGFTPPILEQLVNFSRQSTITLHLDGTHECKFIKEQDRTEESPHQLQTEVSQSLFGGKVTTKVVTKITEYFYKYSVKYQLSAIIGVGETITDNIVIRSRSASQEVVRRSKQSPFPEVETFKHDLEIHQLLSMLDGNHSINFSINRMLKECFTPVRNPDVEKMVVFFHKMYKWLNKLERYFTETVTAAISRPVVDEVSKAARDIFIPLIPLFRVLPEASDASAVAMVKDIPGESTVAPVDHSSSSSSGSSSSSAVAEEVEQGAGPSLTSEDVSLLLQEHQRSLTSKLVSMQKIYASVNDSTNNLFSVAEAQLSVLCGHLKLSIATYIKLIRFVEDLIRSQLIRALGREVSPIDFQLYMSFHYRKLYRPEYQPVPFSYAVRRSPLHTPEGTVRIEIQTDQARVFTSSGGSNGGFQPIDTLCRSSNSNSNTGAAVSEMSMAIDAATRIRFRGVCHVHGWLAQSFKDSSPSPNLRMVASARQFSSYIVLLGSISSATTFEPKFAVMLQNKDELTIPLLLETIPNAKQFRDSIDSLSPEQQRFAKAYRTMQLESTLFGIVLLQVKPQLEQVLQLKPDSLTKEIALTQDIMKLFIDYQIPADLLSYDDTSSAEANTASAEARINSVKENVKKIMTIMDEAKKEELAEKNRQREFEGGPVLMKCAFDERSDVHTSGVSRRCTTMETLAPPPPPVSRAKGSTSAATSSSRVMLSAFSSGATPGAGSAPPAPTMLSANMEQPPQPQSTHCNREELPAELAGAQVEQHEEDEVAAEDCEDYTKLPSKLDAAFDRLDEDHAVRPAIIKPGDKWLRARQKALILSKDKPKTERLSSEDLNKERNAVFDMLDALTRSGALPIENAAVHIVIGAIHSFDHTVMNTVVQRNMNPIESIERSSLIMASTLFQTPSVDALVQASQVGRLREISSTSHHAEKMDT